VALCVPVNIVPNSISVVGPRGDHWPIFIRWQPASTDFGQEWGMCCIYRDDTSDIFITWVWRVLTPVKHSSLTVFYIHRELNPPSLTSLQMTHRCAASRCWQLYQLSTSIRQFRAGMLEAGIHTIPVSYSANFVTWPLVKRSFHSFLRSRGHWAQQELIVLWHFEVVFNESNTISGGQWILLAQHVQSFSSPPVLEIDVESTREPCHTTSALVCTSAIWCCW